MMRVSACGVVLALCLTVAGLVGCPLVTDQGAPEPSFSVTPESGSPPLSVQFADTSSAGTSPIRAWYWDFGDGGTSVLPNPSHIYYAAGSYSVSLTVTTAVGTRKATRENFITVAEPGAVSLLGIAGGTVTAEGATIEVPEQALADSVVFRISKSSSSVPVDAGAGEQLVSTPVCINHNQSSALSLHPKTPIVLRFTYATSMVAAADRTNAKLQILARQTNGVTVPILGEVAGDTVQACVTGLPISAVYAVVSRPAAEEETLAVADASEKTTTSYRWPTSEWRLSYTPEALQALTALRAGTITNPAAYDNRGFSDSLVANALDDLRTTVQYIHALYRDAGFIAPKLCTGADNRFALVLYSANETPQSDFVRLSDVIFALSPYGGIVVDPEQLIGICKKNAETLEDDVLPLLADRNQEINFANAFGQELFHTVFRGYDFTPYAQTSATDVDASNTARQIPFYQGYDDGIATFLGQVVADVRSGQYYIPRSMGTNEYAVLDEPLFAPFSASTAAYSYASQDFLFYVLKMLSLSPSTPEAAVEQMLLFLADSYEGVLEDIRTEELALAEQTATTPTARDAIFAANGAFNLAFERTFGEQVSLPYAYWSYACSRAYENPSVSFLRPRDSELADGTAREAYQLNTDRFSSGAVVEKVISQGNVAQEISYLSEPLLQDIPPLSTRALLLTAQSIYGKLTLTVNAFDWETDSNDNSMKVLACVNGEAGVELSATDAQVVYDDFNGTTGPDEIVMLFSNITTDHTYSVTMNAEVRTSDAGETGFLLGYVVDAVTMEAISGVQIEVRQTSGSAVIASTKTSDLGLFLLTGLPVGSVNVTLSMDGYETLEAKAEVKAGEPTQSDLVSFTMTSSR